MATLEEIPKRIQQTQQEQNAVPVSQLWHFPNNVDTLHSAI